MTVNTEIKDPILRRYLVHLSQHSEGSIHKISRESDFGKYVTSLVKYSNEPVNQNLEKDVITFRLPKSRSLISAENYHLYIKKEDQRKIEDFLKATFNLDADRYFLQGLRQGFQHKEIFEAFIIEREMTDLMPDNERLKKRIYRQSLNDVHGMVKKLCRSARLRNLEIQTNIRGQLIN